MKSLVQIKFDKITLEWEINKDSISQRWAETVSDLINVDLPNRLHYANFHKEEYYYLRMTETMKMLKNNISEMPDVCELDNVSLEYLNDLHNWFSKNKLTNELLSEMHNYLHSLEGTLIYGSDNLPPTIQASWSNTPRFQFSLNDYDNFTKSANFGDMQLTYCHIGKDPLAIFKSKDELSNEVFVPWTHFSADFVMYFGNNCNHIVEKEFWEWFDKNYFWFQQRTDWEKRDIRIVPGNYVIAKLISKVNKQELLELITPESTILEISIK